MVKNHVPWSLGARQMPMFVLCGSNGPTGWGRTVRRLATPWSSLGLMPSWTDRNWNRKRSKHGNSMGAHHEKLKFQHQEKWDFTWMISAFFFGELLNAMGIQWGGLPTIFKPKKKWCGFENWPCTSNLWQSFDGKMMIDNYQFGGYSILRQMHSI